MPAKSDKSQVVCPHCGHSQLESRVAISTNCRQCGQYLRVQELLNPTRKAVVKAPEQRRVSCFDCGTEQDAPVAAQSAMCKRCSSYIDLQDYTINSAVSKNFRTKGRFVIEGKGYIFNTHVVAHEVIIKGRLIGRITADELTVYSSADINGSFEAKRLIVPADNCFRWKERLRVGTIEVIGEFVGDVVADLNVVLRATGRIFGNIQARGLVVEEGAVLVGDVNISAAG